MTDLDDALVGLSPERQALARRLLAERVVRRAPLTSAQQGMWFLQQLDPGSTAYVMPAAVRLAGDLDPDALRSALAAVVARHEALRTTFPLVDGAPVQEVRAGLDLALPTEDLREAPDVAAAVQVRAARALRDPFRLETGPLIRVLLLRTAEREHVLVVTVHHLVSDGWSTAILFSEVATAYGAAVRGTGHGLADLVVQFGDFAVWQAERPAETEVRDLEFWRTHLAGAPTALDLPTDRHRRAVRGSTGGSVPLELGPAVMTGLSALAREVRATTFMAALAVYACLLGRWSGQEDVVVGVPSVNRERPELEPVIGYFLTMLPIRVDLTGEPTFREVLVRVRDAARGAYEHQSTSFDRVVEALRPPRDLARTPVFQTCFSFQSDPFPQHTAEGVTMSRIPLVAGTSRFDLELQAFYDGGSLTGSLDYDSDLFDEGTVTRLAGHLGRLAALVLADPDEVVDRLDLLTPAERHTELVTANDTRRDWPEHLGWVHACIARQAAQSPEAVAVSAAGSSITYAALDARANRLAHRLRALGVGPGVPVAVCAQRSVDLSVAVLAALRAGGAYLPLDPDHPAARTGAVLAEAAPPVVLTQVALRDRFAGAGAVVLALDDPADDPAVEPTTDPEVPLDGQDLAYVIYTSGSTGRPKGVMNVHAGIRNRLLWMQDAYPLGAGDRVLQKTPVSFDVSVWELLWPLMVGATLVMAPPGAHRDPGALARVIREERVTTVHFVPSVLDVFLREVPVEQLTGLRRVICSGEALGRDLQDRFLGRSDAALENLYGPTEAAIDVTAWTCRPDEDDERPVPIGLPIANTAVYVLDRFGRPVPRGVVGELVIGGVNVARGYLGRPDLTAERFVDDPFGPVPGGRLYRTGDLVRRRQDGCLEYRGRMDRQVKVRGVRIEPGEVEGVLTAHPDVRQALVVSRPGPTGGERLVAYVVGAPAAPAAELAAWARERLPGALVPAAFVALDAIPLTPTGKADPAALPDPDPGERSVTTPFAEPAGRFERVVADIWCAVLGVSRVGAEDNFFDLGGHSLQMPVVRERLSAAVDRDVAVVELFQHPTVRSLAAHLAGAPVTQDPVEEARSRADDRRSAQDRRRAARTAGLSPRPTPGAQQETDRDGRGGGDGRDR
ncbi:MAG TPA: amino acid adenylation domain-containing protein [Cellulomonas sp.]